MSKMSFLNFHGLPARSSSIKPAQSRSNLARETQLLSPSRNQHLFNYQTQEIKWVFRKFDTSKDGKISHHGYDESALKALGKGHGKADMAQAFKATDADGDGFIIHGNGFIDLKEFKEMMNSMQGGDDASDLQGAFQVFDPDGSGKISANELLEVLKRMGERTSLDACRRMIAGVDRDGDGLVDMDEFVSMMTRNRRVS